MRSPYIMDARIGTPSASPSTLVASEWAWVLTAIASTLAPLVVGLMGLAFAAAAWCLAASALAAVTGRLLNEPGWYATAARVTIGTLVLLAGQVAVLPALLGALVWALYLLVVPTILFVRSRRSLRSASLLGAGWPSPAIAGAVVCILTLASVAVAVWRTVDTDSESEPIGAVADLTGCYRVVVSPWLPGSPSGSGMSAVIPDVIQLDSVRGPAPASDSSRPPSANNGRFFERDRHLIRPGWKGAAIWRISHGSLRLVWTTGFHGAASDMVRVGSHFVGQIDEFVDFGPGLPRPSALVWLRPTGCDALKPRGT